MTLPEGHRCTVISSEVVGRLLKLTAKVDGRVVCEVFDARSVMSEHGGHNKIVHYVSEKYCLCPVVEHEAIHPKLKPLPAKLSLRHRLKKAIRIIQGKTHEEEES